MPQMLFDKPRRQTLFAQVAKGASNAMGSANAFLLAIGVIVVWGITGPIFGFSDTWQLIINTATTIITFLMVFLIQNTQNRDARAMHLKLDELIRAVESARNQMIDIETLADDDLTELELRFREIRASCRTSRSVEKPGASEESGITVIDGARLPQECNARRAMNG